MRWVPVGLAWVTALALGASCQEPRDSEPDAPTSDVGFGEDAAVEPTPDALDVSLRIDVEVVAADSVSESQDVIDANVLPSDACVLVETDQAPHDVPDVTDEQAPDADPLAPPTEIPANGLDDDGDGWVDEHAHFSMAPADAGCPAGWTASLWGACVNDDVSRVHVAASVTWVGCSAAQDPDCVADEQPQHEVTLAGYAIDVYEVTASRYASCVGEGLCDELTDGLCFWGTTTLGVPDKADHPASCVPWGAARTFCQWAGGDLCTEAQWEKAARGGCDLIAGECASQLPRYVWGDEELLALGHPPGNYSDKTAFDAGAWWDWEHMLDYEDGHVTSAPVGSFPAGASVYGAHDMGGNVWEWVLDCGAASYVGAPVDGSAAMTPDCPMRVARGASFDAVNPWLRVTERGGDAPDHVGHDTGMRCCYAL